MRSHRSRHLVATVLAALLGAGLLGSLLTPDVHAARVYRPTHIRSATDAAELQILRRAYRATVLIVHDGGTGSGAVVRSRAGTAWILTARHVIEDAPPRGITVAFGTAGEPIPARIMAMSENHDLALLIARVDGAPALPVARASPVLGDCVFSIGCPRGIRPVASWGRVSQDGERYVPQLGGWYMMLDFHGARGQSGSAVYNEAGDIVGVVAAILIDSNTTLAVPTDAVRNFLRYHLRGC